jgi:hypothetical protein
MYERFIDTTVPFWHTPLCHFDVVYQRSHALRHYGVVGKNVTGEGSRGSDK